jgi:cytochrome c556
MKKSLHMLLAASLFCIAAGAQAESGQPTISAELRPMQKAMQARAAWLKDMNANLAAMNYAEVGKDATALAAQTDSIGKTLPNPLAKDLTMNISSAATAAAAAAGKQDGAAVKIKLAEIKASCDQCHAKIRDKK